VVIEDRGRNRRHIDLILAQHDGKLFSIKDLLRKVMSRKSPNQTMQRMRASRSAHNSNAIGGWLAPVIVTVKPLRSLKPNRFIFYIALAVSTLFGGCTFLLHPINSTFAPHSNPIEGWHFSRLVNLHNNRAISDDYHDFINKLPPKERKNAGPVFFFEDGTGQHAVQIEIGLNGTSWRRVLIYDKNDKRVKAVKYVSGYYMCSNV
jgi:hypothetical protein